jgi:hypothetical protein
MRSLVGDVAAALCVCSTAGLLAACGTDEPAGTRNRETMVVELSVSSRGIAIERVTPAAKRRLRLHGNPLTALEYRLLDESGRELLRARMGDPRWARSEWVDPATDAFSHADLFFESGVTTIRLPAVAGELIVLEPRPGGAVELGRAAYRPDAAVTELRRPLDIDEVLSDPILIAGGGGKDGAIDLLLLPEAYKEDQLDDFHETAVFIAEGLLNSWDYQEYRDRINVWYMDVRSDEDEMDEDGFFGDDHDTAFDGEWGGGGFLGVGDAAENQIHYGDAGDARHLVDSFDMDIAVMIANADEIRGMFSDDIISMGRDHSGATLAHELGHALLDLGDEYEEDDGTLEGFRCDTQSFFSLHQSVNTQADLEDLPWWDLLTPGVELPTDEDADHDVVGAFEGARQCESGWYRPQIDCLMRNHLAPMCDVCRRELDGLMGALSESPPSCPEEWRDDGLCDLCLDHDEDCEVERVCDSDGFCDPNEHCSACPEDCGACAEFGGCGDGACAVNETDSSCPVDCGCAAGAQCTNGPAPYGCYCDPACEESGDCCADADGDCTPF